MSNDEKDYIVARLTAWARAVVGGVSLPSLSGCLTHSGSASYGSRELWSPEVEEMERAVCLLPEREREVIRELYVRFDATVDQHCKALGMSKSMMHRARNSALVRLLQLLKDLNKKKFVHG